MGYSWARGLPVNNKGLTLASDVLRLTPIGRSRTLEERRAPYYVSTSPSGRVGSQYRIGIPTSSRFALPCRLPHISAGCQFGEENIVITLVGTKLDLIQAGKEREVTREEIDAFCKEHGDIQYIETVRRVGLENLWLTCDQSSKDGTNVEEVRRLSPFRSHARHGRQAFAQTAQLIHERIQSNKIRRPQTKGSSFPNLAQSSADALSRKGCC
jgi:hypothetical protein